MGIGISKVALLGIKMGSFPLEQRQTRADPSGMGMWGLGLDWGIHGIMEWCGWEGALKIILFQPQRFPLSQGAPSVQPGLGCSRDEAATDFLGIWGLTTFPARNSFPVFHLNFPSGTEAPSIPPGHAASCSPGTSDHFPNPSEILGVGTERNSLLKMSWEFHSQS